MNFVNLSEPDDSTFSTADSEPYVAIRGGIIHLLTPRPSEYQPEPTAYALAHKNRFSGNFGVYSVAQHACLVAKLIDMLGGDTSQVLAGLHHDDPEIALGDMPSPMKETLRLMEGHHQSSYDIIELRHQSAVEARYSINLEDPVIKKIDRIILAWEIKRVVPYGDRDRFGKLPQHETDPDSGRIIHIDRDVMLPWEPEEAFDKYMSFHEKLMQSINNAPAPEVKSNEYVS